MRRARPAFAAACLFSGFAGLLAARAAQAQAQAPGVTNAGICASTDDDAYPPQRRVEACSALIDTLADQPTALAAALVNRGTIYWYINKSQLALTDLDRAIALDPKNERAFRERSNTYRTVGRLDKALSDANEAVRLDPNDAQAFEKRGNVFTNNGQYDRAIADYDRAIALDPGFALAYNNRGAAYGRRAISTAPLPIISRRCASIRNSTRPRKTSPMRARNATGALRPEATVRCCRLSIAAPRISRSRKRSVPIPIWRGSTARSGQFTRRRS
jgi:tetratricopeptide (TPR) repeat protein